MNFGIEKAGTYCVVISCNKLQPLSINPTKLQSFYACMWIPHKVGKGLHQTAIYLLMPKPRMCSLQQPIYLLVKFYLDALHHPRKIVWRLIRKDTHLSTFFRINKESRRWHRAVEHATKTIEFVHPCEAR